MTDQLEQLKEKFNLANSLTTDAEKCLQASAYIAEAATLMKDLNGLTAELLIHQANALLQEVSRIDSQQKNSDSNGQSSGSGCGCKDGGCNSGIKIPDEVNAEIEDLVKDIENLLIESKEI